MAYGEVALTKEVLEHHEKAMAIDQQLGNVNGEATDLNNLGIIYQYLGQYEKVYLCFEQAHNLFAKSADKKGEGLALTGFASIDISRGVAQSPVKNLKSTLNKFRETADPALEAKALNNLAMVCVRTGVPVLLGL